MVPCSGKKWSQEICVGLIFLKRMMTEICATLAVLNQPVPVVVGSGSQAASAVSPGGSKLNQVVVTMDANRRTTLSLHQPGIGYQQNQHQAATSDSTAVTQSLMSPARPTILRKRPHES